MQDKVIAFFLEKMMQLFCKKNRQMQSLDSLKDVSLFIDACAQKKSKHDTHNTSCHT
jgi:hypothetical protein